MNLEKIPQYELIMQKRIEDIRSDGYLLRHKKSGARVMVLENDDDNKVFGIAFRTTPTDSTGVAHILEHSVLCGSRNFPSKDPFVELVKGSLNTFLNAMTFPDKTLYPIASCNEKDFRNLMHVYLDAVFYPNIYTKEEIFRQEGWNYQIESPEDEIVYNGVVYNEMKGAFSTPEDVLEREIMNSLFPDNTYGVESGGDPAHIPDLTYEDFLAFHSKYYHPSNSYIYLYGDLDMEERLNWMDREYLSSFDALAVDSEIPLQQPFDAPREVKRHYPVSDTEPLEDNTYLSYNAVIGTSQDVELSHAFAVLDYALLSAPGAALKQALLDAGIGKDIMSSYESGIQQPMFSVIAKNANSADKERFVRLIRDTLSTLVAEGIDKKALRAGINIMEFKAREADFGSYPKGLFYGMDALDSWLYNENAPFDYLDFSVFDKMKERVDSGYFENLVQKYLLDNTHVSIVTVEPERGLTAKTDHAVAEKLHAYKESLSAEQVQELVDATTRLRTFQDAPSPEDALAKLDPLTRNDIEKKAKPFENKEYQIGGTTVLHHDIFTSGIAYLDLLFDTEGISREDIPYLGLLKAVLGMVDTEHYTYQDLNSEININTGGISAGLSVYPVLPDGEKLRTFAGIRAKALYDKLPFALEMAEEILLRSKFDDDKRLYEILAKLRSRLQMMLSGSGHTTAALRAMSYFSQAAAFNDAVNGLAFYRLVEDLEKNFEQRKDALKDKLRELLRTLFRREGLTVSLTSDAEGLEKLRAALEDFVGSLPDAKTEKKDNRLVPEKKNEGFMTAGQVQYVARTGNFVKAGYSYSGLLRILKVMLSYDYLWINLRVKGGAYGCMNSFGRDGDTYFVSYRDPNLRRTDEVYEGIPQYLEEFEADEQTMTSYIIGTFSEIDTPLNPSAQGLRALSAYFSGLTDADVQKERDEVLQATPEQIRTLAPLVRAVLSEQAFCVIGNEEKIRAEQEMFGSIQMLTGTEEMRE